MVYATPPPPAPTESKVNKAKLLNKTGLNNYIVRLKKLENLSSPCPFL
jgi:hypothetical protein